MFEIGIDARMIGHSGIGTYLRGLLSALDETQAFCTKASLHGTGDYSFLKGSWSKHSFDASIYSISEQFQFKSQLRRCRLWHSIHYNVPYFKGETKLVVTIHDIIHWIFRKKLLSPLQQVYAGVMLARAVNLSDHIITVSQTTKRDLVEHFDADPEKITVTYEGVSGVFKKVNTSDTRQMLAKKYGIQGPYFLYVGLLKPHKNVHWLVEKFLELKSEKGMDASLVLIGKKDKTYSSECEILNRLDSLEGIHSIPYAEIEELREFYTHAIALVHPSLYEGFGLTILEAMACETPVIASKAGALPEVVGDAGILFDPTKEDELKRALMRMLQDESERQNLVTKGLEQVKNFSWKKMAEETLNVYDEVLAQ